MANDRRKPLRVALVVFGAALLVYPLMIVHGGIMAVQAIVDPAERGHLPGDVAALLLVALVLGLLAPRGVVARGGAQAA